MDMKNVILTLLFIGVGYATVQLQIRKHVPVTYMLCTDQGAPDEECSTDGVFKMNRCMKASLQMDVSAGTATVISDGETLFEGNDFDARELMFYTHPIFCNKPVAPLLLRKTTYKGKPDVWIKAGRDWTPSATNDYEGECGNEATSMDIRCLRLTEINVNVPEGHDVNKLDATNMTALVWAIGFGDLESVQRTVANGAKLNQIYHPNDLTAAHMATISCNTEILKFLIEKGESVDVVNKQGKTPLHIACNGGSLKTVSILLNAYKGNVNAKDEMERTALHYAAMVDDPTLVDLLLSSGANITDKDENGFTALHYAARTPEGKVIEQLVSLGIPVDEPNNNGTTPLMMSVTHLRPKPMETLIKLNANLEATDKDGNTFLTFFRKLPQYRKPAFEEILKAHGVQITAE